MTCLGGSNHGIYEWSSVYEATLAIAQANVKKIDVVMITELYAESFCIMMVKVTGKLPNNCIHTKSDSENGNEYDGDGNRKSSNRNETDSGIYSSNSSNINNGERNNNSIIDNYSNNKSDNSSRRSTKSKRRKVLAAEFGHMNFTWGMPFHSVSMLNSTTLKKIDDLTVIDLKLYKISMLRFLHDLEEVESKFNVTILTQTRLSNIMNDLMHNYH